MTKAPVRVCIGAASTVVVPPDQLDFEPTVVDGVGEAVVYGAVQGRRRWIRVRDVADFSWTAESNVLEATPHPRADHDLVLDELQDVAIPLFLHAALNYEVVHAAAVTSASGVFGFCGSSGSGKSTIAHGLGLRGHNVWADDVLAFQVYSNDSVATALPFRPNLRTASRAFFRRDASDSVAPVTVAPWSTERLSGLFALAPAGRTKGSDGTAEVTRLNAADALAALLPHGMRFKPLDKPRERRILTAYVELIACVPIFNVAYEWGFAGFPSLLDRLESVIQAIDEES